MPPLSGEYGRPTAVYFRLLRRDDLQRCAQLLHPAFKTHARARAALPELWKALLAREQLYGGVVVERAHRGGETIVAFGMAAFVDDAFVEELLASPRPYISAVVYDAVLSGGAPILDRDAVAAANARGDLNLVVLHFGIQLSEPPSAGELAAVATAHGGFRLLHEGYNVKRVVQEVYGPTQVAFLTAGGFRLESDLSDWYARSGTPEPPPAGRPYLMAVCRSDAEAQLPGSTVSFVFREAAPRFGFSPAEQRVLQRALFDEDDGTIAEALAVSHDAVKKIWRGIYERIVLVDPGLLQDAAPTRPAATLVRGKEKRRKVVRFLRNHLHELRPYKRSSGRR
jgi:hypothetical protein